MSDLMDRYQTLSNKILFNPDTFADEWTQLGQDFDKEGRHSMADGCFSRAEWYRGTDKGYAQKLTYVEDGPVPIDGQRTSKDERMLECITCGWTKHVRYGKGWACACGEFIVEFKG